MAFPRFRLSIEDLKAGHFAPLLAALVLVLFVLHPILRPFPVMALVLDVSFVVVLVLACYAVADHHRALILSGLLFLSALGFGIAGLLTGIVALRIVGDAMEILFFGYVALAILGRVLSTKEFTLDSIFGAVCVYILMGLMWAFIYSLIEDVSPGSFAVNAALEEIYRGAVRPSDIFFYFSFVTLTTLGYGDISPVSEPARMMASLEAIAGPLFVAILVAWLVSEASGSFNRGR